jgi:uncharacterized membrane protein YcaP (DUF421 family)
MEWSQIFSTDLTELAEVMIRGSITYLVLLAMLRALRRESGALNVPDLIVIVIVADAAQNAMAGQYISVSAGVVLVGTILLWSYLLDFLGYHVPAIGRLIRPGPVTLVRDGQMLIPNMRRNLITREELLGLVREQGLPGVERVRRAFLEGDGQISIVPESDGEPSSQRRRRIGAV